MNPKDTQIIEIIGRNRLVNELLAAGLEVAQPIRDRGVDLIAYLDIDDALDRFVAFPVQLKASSGAAFTVSRKYNKFPNLIIAYVWGVSQQNKEGITYGLTQTEAVGVAAEMGWTNTSSWIDQGLYTTTNPSDRVINLLEPYRMSPEAWRQKLFSLAFPSS